MSSRVSVREGDVVQPAGRTGPVLGVDDVVRLVGVRQPTRRDPPGVEPDLLGRAGAQHPLLELGVGEHVGGEEVDVVQAADADSPVGLGPGLVLQRRAQLLGGRIMLAFPVQGVFMAVRIGRQVQLPEAGFVLGPGAGAARLLDRPDTAVQCLLAGGAQGEPAEAGPFAGGESTRLWCS